MASSLIGRTSTMAFFPEIALFFKNFNQPINQSTNQLIKRGYAFNRKDQKRSGKEIQRWF